MLLCGVEVDERARFIRGAAASLVARVEAFELVGVCVERSDGGQIAPRHCAEIGGCPWGDVCSELYGAVDALAAVEANKDLDAAPGA